MIKLFGINIRPEVEKLTYWIHIGIILGVVYGLMQLYNPGQNILLYGLYLVLGDVVAHSVLRMN